MASPDASEPADPAPDPAQDQKDHVIETVIGHLLRVCVIATSIIVVIGAVIYLPGAVHEPVSYSTFHGEPAAFRSVTGILHAALSGDGRAIVESGLLLLVLTPILRVAFSAVAFLIEKDYLYVGLTLIVLGLLLYSVVAG